MLIIKYHRIKPGYLVAMLSLTLISSLTQAQPTVTEYAKCSGILVMAAALTKTDAPDKSSQYITDAEALQTKASQLNGYNKGIYMEMSFDSSGNYMEMLKRGGASKIDFWSDAGYCRGLAQ